MSRRTGKIAWTLLGIWLAVVGWLTLRSDPTLRDVIRTTRWSCLVCGAGGTTDTILNLILYAPFGVIAWRSGWRLSRLVTAALVLSSLVELTQGTLLQGRDATLGDVVSNTLGATMGWWLGAMIASMASSRTRARLVTTAVLGVQGLVWLGTGFGIRPALDGAPPWVGRFQRSGSGQVPFVGTVGATLLDGIPVTTEPMERLPAPGDSLHLSIALTKGEPSNPLVAGSILRMVDADPRVFVRVISRGDDITVETALRATRWRFRTPTWRFSGALAIPTMQPVRLDWSWHSRSIELRRTAENPAVPPLHDERALALGLGWALVHPFVQVIGDSARYWTVLWLVGWFGLLGWSGGMAGRRFGIASIAAGLMTFALAGVVTGLPVGGSELLAACAGGMAGAVLAGTVQRRTPRT